MAPYAQARRITPRAARRIKGLAAQATIIALGVLMIYPLLWLLMIPGFLTDIVALLLVLPFPRDALGRWLLNRLRASGSLRVWTSETRSSGARTGQVIDVEYSEVPTDAPRLGESRWSAGGPKEPGQRP